MRLSDFEKDVRQLFGGFAHAGSHPLGYDAADRSGKVVQWVAFCRPNGHNPQLVLMIPGDEVNPLSGQARFTHDIELASHVPIVGKGFDQIFSVKEIRRLARGLDLEQLVKMSAILHEHIMHG